LAALRHGPRAQRATAAGQALAPRELGVHDLVAPTIAPGLPQHADFALRAGHPPRLPVDDEMGDVEPPAGLRLPAHIRPRRPDQPHAVLGRLSTSNSPST